MRFIALISLLALAACDPGPIRGTIDSGANRLTVGMTPDQVDAIIGTPSDEVSVGNELCRSYVYDETLSPRFLHALFVDGMLAQTSERHMGACVLGA